MSTDRRYGVISGLGVKAPCAAATTAPITLSGLQTIDGIVLVAGDRVLVKNQVDTTTNGIYAADTSTWTRDVDFDGQLDVVQGTCVIVAQGAISANVAYQLLAANPVIIGTSGLTFAVNPYLSSLAASPGSSLVGFIQSGTGSVARPVQDKLREVLSPTDKGVVTTGLVDATTGLAAAIADIQATGGKIFLPRGKLLLNGGTASADGYKNGMLLPFLAINADSTKRIIIEGDQTVLQCGSNNMVLARIARNDAELRNITLDANGKTGVILCAIAPEDMTQTTTQVSQSYTTLRDVDRVGGAGITGLLIQPGPQVGGSDSGCFYTNVFGGVSNFVGGGRHVYTKKNADWGTHPNRPTRTNFFGQRCIRGNVGYHFEVGSEIELHGCYEELINSADAAFLATPTARYISADAASVTFHGGYSEACTRPVDVLAKNFHRNFGYSASTAFPANWATNMESFGDVLTPADWSSTCTIASSGGGAAGASTSTAWMYKTGSTVTITANVSVAKGTLGAGNLTIPNTSGIFVALASIGVQVIPITKWSGITFAANYSSLVGFMNGGATITIYKNAVNGAAPIPLTLAECSDPITFTLQGSYII